MDGTRVKLARQALAAHQARLATTADRDGVRRQIRAARERLALELERQGRGA